MINKYYAGIGSRTTPPWNCRLLTDLAIDLDKQGYVLRSGGAKGADLAFEMGASHRQILRAKDATPEAIEIASRFHPAWGWCNDYARRLHGRNVMIVLGKDLFSHVDFVSCWTADEERGGTSLGIRVARHYNIPVYNYYKLFLEKFPDSAAAEEIRNYTLLTTDPSGGF